MDSPPKLSGETLIVHHLPLVHCQVTGRCGSIKRPAPFGPPEGLSLTRTTSLPEQEGLQRDALVYSSQVQTSSSSSTSSSGAGLGGGGRAGGGTGRDRGSLASDDSSSFTSNASEDPPPPPPAPPLLKPRDRGHNTSRHNPFLLNAEDEEEEGDEEGGNLNGYLEDSSFHLHGNTNANVSLAKGAETSPFLLHDFGYAPEPFLLHDSLGGAWGSTGSRTGATDGQERAQNGPSGAHSQLQSLGLPGLEAQRRHGSSGSTLSMEWGDEEDEEDEDHPMSVRACSCCSSSDAVPPASCSSGLSEPFAEDEGLRLHQCYGSDSSCNSSDGVLVNFSAIYNKMNNAVPSNAKPANLNGSVERCRTSSSDEPGGAFYLDLQSSPTEPRSGLDANCNSYAAPREDPQDLTSCFQSQVRLVVATQNYYKLVTCDLSSQSSPSPLASSVTSCPEEPQGASPTQPTEYYLFRQEEDELSQKEEEDGGEEEEGGEDPTLKVIEGQVYVNASPPVGAEGGDKGRLRSRSYDRHLDRSPSPRLGSLERMLSCPVRLSDGTARSPAPPPPPRVTSFAEIARSKRRNGGGGAAAWFAGAAGPGSPCLRAGSEASSSQSLEISPIPELLQLSHSHSLPPLPFTRRDTSPHPHRDPPGAGHREARTKAEGGLSSSSEVVRYSKDQRPTSLPIQPFTLHQQLGQQQGKFLRPLLTEYVNNMQGRAPERPPEEPQRRQAPAPAPAPAPGPGSVRPSPLGSYSPVRQQREPCSSSPRPPRSLSCPLSAGLLPVRPAPGGLGHSPEPPLPLQAPPPPPPPLARDPPTTAPPTDCLHHRDFVAAAEFSPLGHADPAQHCDGGTAGQSCCSGPRPPNGQSAKQQNYYSDIFPDYFSLSERPPDEFCLSPDASSESLSIDLLQKKALVKAINTAVDLIVAHFGTSRDPGVKAKLGNSSVSPNVGHLILKYLCPAIRDILQDGLRGYVLDLIIGQRRNVPWSVVEASTQLGPSTRVLHGLYSKVSQYSELTGHSMRLNAFIFGLLNLRSLEFWFNHLYTHEDIVAAHYHPWGFLPLSQGACQPLYEELLLLLQPLSLLPFHLDLLFEPELLQRGQEHLRRKEQLCSNGEGLEQSSQSTFQRMRGWGSLGAEPKREAAEPRKEGAQNGTEGAEPRREALGVRSEGRGGEAKRAGLRVREGSREQKVAEGRGEPRREVGGAPVQRAKGVGSESGEAETDRSRDGDNGGRPRDRQAGWWYQLMQSSQVYIDNSAEGSKFVKWEKRKKPAGEAGSGRGGGAGRRLSPPPPREGVVEGAEAGQEGAGLKERGGSSSSSSSESSVTARGWRSWMGSPPESVSGDLKRSQEPQSLEAPGAAPGAQEEGPSPGLRWSRLFGAGTGAPLRPENVEQSRLAKSQKSRLPSGWLSLDKSVLDIVAQTVGAGKRPDPPSQSQAPPPVQKPEAPAAKQRSLREVRALCDLSASEAGQLSFSKGDVLRVLSHAQADWLLCARGQRTGLVPVVYVTLGEDPQGPQGPH
ncbi:AP-4 complex accessory subunit RUSC2-like [Conger conger]|uniref:AP-4 complex accessory subunit RUSC2-like n=1 Tax=Conger conger TaxID=82655 RepID=UPI002A5A8F3D|nr:AP-4 complex accessory subunit RUSC2-like [Conger conger]